MYRFFIFIKFYEFSLPLKRNKTKKKNERYHNDTKYDCRTAVVKKQRNENMVPGKGEKKG